MWPPWAPPLATLALLAYLALARALRFRRARRLPLLYGVRTRADLAKMTTAQAQRVVQELYEQEFPWAMGVSIAFALFKTFGIPSISALLAATGELSTGRSSSKRTADTGVILLELLLNPPHSRRARRAIARMNYLHARHASIAQDDMLYTLAQLAVLPAQWVRAHEWRCLSDFEACALGTFWKNVGDGMRVSSAPLPSSRTGWSDGLHWLRELEDWSAAYESRYMVPARSSAVVARARLDAVFAFTPAPLRTLQEQVVFVLMGPRLRTAFSLPEPQPWIAALVSGVLRARKAVLRHAALPRPWVLRKQYIEKDLDATTGRGHFKFYAAYPWYVRPTLAERWGVDAWTTRLLGGKVPGDDGDAYAPQGYFVPDVGPAGLRGKGRAEMARTEEEELARADAEGGGCPFHVQIHASTAGK